MLLLVAISVLAGFASCQSTSGCPAGLDTTYLDVQGSYCYQFAIVHGRDYVSAQNDCKLNGGTLAIIKDQATQNYLYQKLLGLYTGSDSVWIGLNDRQTEGTFVWEDGSPVSYDNWESSSGPDNRFTGPTSDCVAIDPYDGTWIDYHCENTGILSLFSPVDFPYICQYPVPE